MHAACVAVNAVAVRCKVLIRVIAPVPKKHEAYHSESLCKGPNGLSHTSVVQTLDVIFYGDSITESWRGLQAGVPTEKFKGIPQVFEKMYGSVKAAAYSISGDTRIRALQIHSRTKGAPTPWKALKAALLKRRVFLPLEQLI